MSVIPPIDKELVSELRLKVLNAVEEQGTEHFHPVDVDRIRQDDLWVWRFLLHQRNELSWAFDMAMECLKWRKEFGVNDIKESEFPSFFEDIGALYAFNKDRDGHRIVIMHVCRYRKEPLIFDLTKRYLVYNLEKCEQEKPYIRNSILFDMQGAGYQNVDMEYLAFLFSCLKTYYPYSVAHIYALEMPWLLSAVWTIVKGWMSARALSTIKFVKKSTIREYIDPDQLLVEFGGNNPYKHPTCDPPDPKTFMMADGTINMLKNGTLDMAKKKVVHFAESSFEDNETTPIETEESHLSTAIKLASTHGGKFIEINPSDELVFPASINECSVAIILISNTTNTVAFKVKTTSPAKYRVRPSVGIIRPGFSAEVQVTLLPGFPMSSLSSDKFLVIAMEVKEEHVSLSELSVLWQTVPREQLLEHKIRCISAVDASSAQNDLNIKPQAVSSNNTANLISKVDELLLQNTEIKQEVKRLRNTMYTILLFHLFIVILGAVIAFQYEIYPESMTSKFAVDSCVRSNVSRITAEH